MKGKVLTWHAPEKAKRDYEAGRQAYWHGQPRRIGMPAAWLSGWQQAKNEHRERTHHRLEGEERTRDYLRNQQAMELKRRGAGNSSGTSGKKGRF